MDNYRPISILPVVSKIIERHVHNHLYAYITETGLLCENQSGFRKNHSCQTCLINIVEYCYEHINNGNIVGLISLDFRKAFDIMQHDILCKKLRLYGCNNITVNWFNSYLSGRTQHVMMNNVTSNQCYVKHGVPQGSILGPLLFVIYINDLVMHCTECSLHKYADDSNLIVAGKTVTEINCLLSKDLQNIEDWCLNNRFALNLRKCNFMMINSSQRKRYIHMSDFNLTLCDEPLTHVSHQKILGLNVDNNLTWRAHVDTVCGSISSLIGLMYWVRNCLDFNSVLLFYNSYILPRIDYCLTLWGNAPVDSLLKLFRLQKRAGRIILNVRSDTPSEYVFAQLNWMSVFQRVTYQKCLCMFNIVNGLCPNYLKKLANVHSPNKNYSLRSNSQHSLHIPFPHKELYKKSLKYSGSHIWNILPISVKSAPNFICFKRACKQFILTNIPFNCKLEI